MGKMLTRFPVVLILFLTMTGGLLAACNHTCAGADTLDYASYSFAAPTRGGYSSGSSSSGSSFSGSRSSGSTSSGSSSSGSRSSSTPSYSGSRSSSGSSGSTTSSGTTSRGSNTQVPTFSGSKSSSGSSPSFSGSRSSGTYTSPGARYSGPSNIGRSYSVTTPGGTSHVFLFHGHSYYAHLHTPPDPYDPYDYRNFNNPASPYFHQHVHVPC